MEILLGIRILFPFVVLFCYLQYRRWSFKLGFIDINDPEAVTINQKLNHYMFQGICFLGMWIIVNILWVILWLISK